MPGGRRSGTSQRDIAAGQAAVAGRAGFRRLVEQEPFTKSSICRPAHTSRQRTFDAKPDTDNGHGHCGGARHHGARRVGWAKWLAVPWHLVCCRAFHSLASSRGASSTTSSIAKRVPQVCARFALAPFAWRAWWRQPAAMPRPKPNGSARRCWLCRCPSPLNCTMSKATRDSLLAFSYRCHVPLSCFCRPCRSRAGAAPATPSARRTCAA
jgi:hypothetical protein